MTEKKPRTDDSIDSRAALTALKRAAEAARKTAIQTDTAIIVVENGKRLRITAEQLRKEQSGKKCD